MFSLNSMISVSILTILIFNSYKSCEGEIIFTALQYTALLANRYHISSQVIFLTSTVREKMDELNDTQENKEICTLQKSRNRSLEQERE